MLRTTTRERSAAASLFATIRLPALLDEGTCLELAKGIVEDLRRLGMADHIEKIRYKSTEQGHVDPRLFLKDLTHVNLPEPASQVERTKLAAVLYCVGRLLGAEMDILSVCPVSDYGISTKHQGTHAGRLQRGLDDALFAAQNGHGVPPTPAEETAVDGIPLDAAQREALQSLDGRDRCEWRALARLAGRGRTISPRHLSMHRERTGVSLEDLFRLNERRLRPLGLAFEIDYGTIDFDEHMAGIEELEARLLELSRELQAAAVLGQGPGHDGPPTQTPAETGSG